MLSLNGESRYRDSTSDTGDGRPDRGRRTEQVAGAYFRWPQVLENWVFVSHVLVRLAGSRSQQPPRDDQAPEHDDPQQCASHHPAGRTRCTSYVGDGGHRLPLNPSAGPALCRLTAPTS
ncbi:MAG TPA: hypothetical protein VK887_08255 [Pseudonocardiaceae bacterium]|nr:hypothetical protein [Pseudonocardiaceae bacterium]